MGINSLPLWKLGPRPGKPHFQFFIDAWNVGDGALYVSYRASREDVWREDSDFGAETYLLRAPDFDVVSVPRSLAYGSVRRGSQEGFSLDGQQEVAFETLAQVRELARRAYVASAIGDAGPEGDAPPQDGPPPPDTGPSFPAGRFQPERWWEWSEDLAQAVEALSIETSGPAPDEGRLKLRRVIQHALTSDAVERGAALLLASADRTLEILATEHASVPVARSLVYLASCLVGAGGVVRLGSQLPIGGQAHWMISRMFNHPWPLGWGYGGQGRDGAEAMRLLCDGLLPEYRILDHFKVPPRCILWIDILEYLSTDREYYKLGRDSAWLPLAIAVACIATAPRLPLEPWLDGSPDGNKQYRSAWLERIADYIAAMVPAGGLPSDVETWIRDRCWSHQRGR